MSEKPSDEGLKFARAMMVVSSLAPLFILWAIRGVEHVPDCWLWTTCAICIFLPFGMLVARLQIVKKRRDIRTLTIRNAHDNREHLLVYLFAMLIPLYDVNLGSVRNAVAALVALTFVVFLFWHLNLHYMNIFFALKGYRVFTIQPVSSNGKLPFVLLSKRATLIEGETVTAYRISNSVFLEPEEQPWR